jgi:hypothetical protein
MTLSAPHPGFCILELENYRVTHNYLLEFIPSISISIVAMILIYLNNHLSSKPGRLMTKERTIVHLSF